MTKELINEIYPLAALFIHANNKQVTKENLQAIFKALDTECQPKICEYFEIEESKINDMITSSTQGGAPVATGATSAAAATETKAAEKVEEEEQDAEIDFDFF